jgi:hypothetical protein
MSRALLAAKQELRSVPTDVLRGMLDDNVAEYESLRARGVPCYAPEFDHNCTLFLILSDALAERDSFTAPITRRSAAAAA